MIRPPLRPGIDSRRPIRRAAVGNSYSVRDSSGGICRGWQWAPGRRDWQMKPMVLVFRYTSNLRISPSRHPVPPGIRGLRTRPPPLLSRCCGSELTTIFNSITIPHSPASNTPCALPSTFRGQGCQYPSGLPQRRARDSASHPRQGILCIAALSYCAVHSNPSDTLDI